MTPQFKIAIAEDHAFWRQALVDLITKNSKLNLTITAENGSDLITQLRAASEEFHPQILVTDLSMPVMDGLELSKWMRRHQPSIKVIAMTLNVNLATTVRLLRAGVKGFLDKSVSADKLTAAIEAVFAGESYFSDSWTVNPEGIIDSPSLKQAAIALIEKWNSLSEREKTFISLYGSDKSLEDIAIQLNIKPGSAKELSNRLLSLFGVSGKVELMKLVKETHLFED